MRSKRQSVWLCLAALLLALTALQALSLQRTLPEKLYVSKDALVRLPLKNTHQITYTTTTSAPLSATAKEGILLDTSAVGTYEVDVKLFGLLPFKKVAVQVVENGYVIPGGESLGIRIYTDGVLTVALTQITDTDGRHVSPARHAGLQVGDVLLKLNGQKIVDADHFSDLLTQNGENAATIEYVRAGKNYTLSLTPARTEGGFKIGAWVRDSTAGLGTLTFVRPDKGIYGALGHGIADIDTAQLLSVLDGNVTPCEITAVTPGQKGTPGQLCGTFAPGNYGTILSNSAAGIYGIWQNKNMPTATPVPVANRFEIREGEAKLRFAPDGKTPKEFDIRIEKLRTAANDERSMVIRITDPTLLEITGGIVQGMSGSPLIQNGKLIGAVTHVFVNDPTRGYGIFIENMLAEAEKIK